MKVLILAMLILVSCGSDESGESAQDVSVSAQNEKGVDSPHSITLKSKDDLPVCEEANDTQLAYIKDEELFYVCESGEWLVAEIKGEDGEDGVDGVDGTNASNTWTDPITGYTWLLGSTGTLSVANATCSGSYRLPDGSEALDAVAHGIRSIATDISVDEDFWTSDADIPTGGQKYATMSAGVPALVGGNAIAIQSIFCVSN